MRTQFLERLASMRAAIAETGEVGIDYHAAGVELGRLWAAELIEQQGTGLNPTLMALGVSEGLLTEMTRAIDARN